MHRSESKIRHSDTERKHRAGEQKEFNHIRKRTTHNCRGGLTKGKETHLQITDRGTDVKEPAGIRVLSWELPHFPGAHGALTQPLPAEAGARALMT